MIALTGEVFKMLAGVTYVVTGQNVVRAKRGETARLQIAVDLAKGKALLLRLTASQAASFTGVPLSVLQGALTRKGLRKSRKVQLSPQPVPGTPEEQLEHVLDVLGADVVFDKALARAATAGVGQASANGAGNGATGTAT
ncbi:MAG: hypothetical protein WAO08_37995 [Hyphomicrobiaceae bacterium]